MVINRRLDLMNSFFKDSFIGKRGIEFGPYDRPYITREFCPEVSYADVFSTQELIKRATINPLRDPKNVVLVDYVTINESIDEQVSPGSLDFVFCSHILEHVPNLIGQLEEIHQCLKIGGSLLIAYPDRRFTFDIDRKPTLIDDLLHRYKNNLKQPDPQIIYDYFSNYRDVMVGRLWKGMENAVKPNKFTQDHARAMAERSKTTYIDCHCNIFTDIEFIEFIEFIKNKNMLSFEIEKSFPTVAPNNEFFLKLKKV